VGEAERNVMLTPHPVKRVCRHAQGGGRELTRAARSGCGSFLHAYPRELSGGMKDGVFDRAGARHRTQEMLMDEPLARARRNHTAEHQRPTCWPPVGAGNVSQPVSSELGLRIGLPLPAQVVMARPSEARHHSPTLRPDAPSPRDAFLSHFARD